LEKPDRIMKMKIKLNPSENIKKRYVLIENADKESAEKVVLDYLGILGWAKAKPSFVNEAGKVILAVDRKMINDVIAALELGKIKVSRVSGTLKGLSKNL